jgi:hypothetical protein
MYIREPATQTCPELRKTLLAMAGMALSRSASPNRIWGDFPPSSRVVCFTFSAAARAISLPVAVDPVKVILSTPRWDARAAPVVVPRPVMTFTTPAGNPASATSRARCSTEQLASSEGFSTMVHPAASAGASFQTASISGTFQGMMAPTTPNGSRRV